MEQGKHEAAERLCQKKEGEGRAACFGRMADYYLKEKQFQKAAVYFAKADDHAQVVNSYFRGDLVEAAEKYCQGLRGEAGRACSLRLGRKFYLRGDYTRAIHYYKEAGENERVLYIESRVPLFELVEGIENKLTQLKRPELKARLNSVKGTIYDYIYMDKYRKWPHSGKSEIEGIAAALFNRALEVAEDQVLPAFIRQVRLDTLDLSQEKFEILSFEKIKLDSLLKLIKTLHQMTEKRAFFRKYSVIYRGDRVEQGQAGDLPGSVNYDEVVMKVLDHMKELLKTIVEAEGIKKKEWMDDYKYNMDIDLRVIDYISLMIDNAKTRIEDIRQRSLSSGKPDRDLNMEKSPESLFWEFVAVVNRVFHTIAQDKYDEANVLLISGYNAAKSKLEKFSRESSKNG